MEYRIDDLAQAAGTTVRNVRAYQERGLLPPPSGKAGRASLYDESHLERLRLIDSLLERGFTTAHIADFITSWTTGKDISEVLGLQHAVTAPWAKDDVLEVPRELVEGFLGTGDGAVLARLAELNLVRMQGDTVVFTEPHLLETFAELHGFGIELRSVIDVYARIADRIDDIAQTLIRSAKQHITDKHGPGWIPDTHEEITETTEMLEKMRELGVGAVHSTLARALDQTLAAELGDHLAAAVEHDRRRALR